MTDMILVPFQLRHGVIVQLRLPTDLSQSEAQRVARVVMSYVDESGVFSAPKPTWAAMSKPCGGSHD